MLCLACRAVCAAAAPGRQWGAELTAAWDRKGVLANLQTACGKLRSALLSCAMVSLQALSRLKQPFLNPALDSCLALSVTKGLQQAQHNGLALCVPAGWGGVTAPGLPYPAEAPPIFLPNWHGLLPCLSDVCQMSCPENTTL